MSLGVASLDASERFGVSTGAIALLSTVRLGVYLAMQVPADRLGPRRSLTLGSLAMGAGELLFAVSPAPGPAMFGRAPAGCADRRCALLVRRRRGGLDAGLRHRPRRRRQGLREGQRGRLRGAIVSQPAIGPLISVQLDYRLALSPLLALAAWGAVQATRHASLRPLWSSSRA